MPEPRHPRGLIDTSVIIDLELIESAEPAEVIPRTLRCHAETSGPAARSRGMEQRHPSGSLTQGDRPAGIP
jgi:hypothetical protein